MNITEKTAKGLSELARTFGIKEDTLYELACRKYLKELEERIMNGDSRIMGELIGIDSYLFHNEMSFKNNDIIDE